MTHSQTLMVMAQDLLRQCGKSVEDVTHVAVAAGPGSFTGVRIGVAAAKGFAWGAELPCCGVSTLEAMALGLGAWSGYVCPVMDARRAQVYNALFRVDQGQYQRIAPDRAISLEDLSKELSQLQEPVFLVGDGSVLTYQTLSKEVPNLVLPAHWKQHQRAVGVGLAALEQLRRGESCDGAALVPNYLRLSQAERERMERMNSNQ
jgi:tRNA threonylcarbamoyladenosine biosynthesis protein TsaB